jgi:hypothetical protein
MGLSATGRLHTSAFTAMMRSPMAFFNLTPVGYQVSFLRLSLSSFVCLMCCHLADWLALPTDLQNLL